MSTRTPSHHHARRAGPAPAGRRAIALTLGLLGVATSGAEARAADCRAEFKACMERVVDTLDDSVREAAEAKARAIAEQKAREIAEPKARAIAEQKARKKAKRKARKKAYKKAYDKAYQKAFGEAFQSAFTEAVEQALAEAVGEASAPCREASGRCVCNTPAKQDWLAELCAEPEVVRGCTDQLTRIQLACNGLHPDCVREQLVACEAALRQECRESNFALCVHAVATSL